MSLTFDATDSNQKYNIQIDYAYFPANVVVRDEESKDIIFRGKAYKFDDSEELYSDELLWDADILDAAYYDAILLARKIYRDSKLTAVQIQNKPIIVLPYSYSPTNDPECAKLIATAMAMTDEISPGSDTPYTAVALNLTPRYDYIGDSFDYDDEDDIDECEETDFREDDNDIDDEEEIDEEIINNLKIYHQNALDNGFVEPQNSPTVYAVSRYVIYWPHSIPEQQRKKEKTPKSLKRDRYPYIKDGNAFVYEEGCEIDCYHRLRLTKQSLILLKDFIEFATKVRTDSQYLVLDTCFDISRKKFEEFVAQFNNPFDLDIEETYAEKCGAGMRFYDYDYCYHVQYLPTSKWSIVCTKGFPDDNETEVEMDTV